MPVDMEELERTIATDTAKPEDAPKTDRGDDFTPSETPITELEGQPAPAAKEEVKEPAKEEVKEPAKEEAKEPVKEEAKDPAQGEEPARDPDTGRFIPKWRFDELNKRHKARIEELERQNAELLSKHAPKEGEDVAQLESQLDTLVEEHQKLLADGDLDKAKSKMREINQVNRRISYLELAPVASQQATAVSEADHLQDLVTFYEQEFPELDHSSNKVNEAALQWVAEKQGVFERAGYSSPRALQEAVTLAMSVFSLVPLSERKAAPKAAPKPDAGKQRTEEATRRAVDTAAKQPAGLQNIGTDSDKQGMQNVDPRSLSYDDFSKLPESTLKRLRGDLL
jgi:hypothetical protein